MRIHHLALRTRKRAALVRFYRDVLGLAVLQTTPRSVWLDAGGAIVMIERRARGEPALPTGSMELVAFGVSRAAHAAMRARLLRRGVAIEASTEFTSYFRDPDGRRVAVSHHPLRGVGRAGARTSGHFRRAPRRAV